MRIDLHTHTVASDGLLTATQLVGLARRWGVGILAVADHDSTESVEEAVRAGREVGIEVIPAVELNTDVPQTEVHILGYFIDHRLEWLQALLRRLREGRLHRAQRMVEKLAALGAPIRLERVLALAGGGAVGRPHVARALVEAGHVSETAEAFARYIGRNGPAYVERLKVAPAQAVEIIRRAGGVAVLAHPGWLGDETMVEELLSAGLEGIEAYYPDHTPAMVERYLQIARSRGLLVTGGTDFHGGDLATRLPPGSQYVPPEAVDRLRERARGRRPAADAPALELAEE
ncbi:MAG: PHP domain-containing protein [Armatimonadota bacterium]|nr:PHP domain-containing protein [Armatimonadota bacterium]MDR7468772.1 PHP domain-containing protein [Armatimonadota bacterium]MDR7538599.1 PHP domain-containing protein [Armatimonadota bacterium]